MTRQQRDERRFLVWSVAISLVTIGLVWVTS